MSQGTPPSLSVLVADARPLFAESVARALDAQAGLRVFSEYPSRGLAALDAVRRLRPDVVVYDNWMLELDGPAATEAICASVPGTKVLVTSWYHGTHHIRAALGAGAAGFVPKSLRLAQLAHAVHRAGAGEALVYAEQLAGLVDDLDERVEAARRRFEGLASLTPRELEVLSALADGTTPAEAAEALSITFGTLKNHVHSILAKTGARTQLQAVTAARHEGFFADAGQPRTAPCPSGSGFGGPVAAGARPAPRRRSDGRASVLVADTQALFAEALAGWLGTDRRLAVIPAVATRAGEAIDSVLSLRPDVVVYDLHLRDMEGTAVIRALARWAPGTKVVVVSWYSGRPQVRRALAAAPDIVIPSSATLASLGAAVVQAAGRDPQVHAGEVDQVLDLLDGGHDERLERLLCLNPREAEVLRYLAHGRPLKEVAAELGLAVGSVKNLASSLNAKLGVRTQLEAVTLAREGGFVW